MSHSKKKKKNRVLASPVGTRIAREALRGYFDDQDGFGPMDTSPGRRGAATRACALSDQMGRDLSLVVSFLVWLGGGR